MGSVRILVVDPKSVQWTVRGVTGDLNAEVVAGLRMSYSLVVRRRMSKC